MNVVFFTLVAVLGVGVASGFRLPRLNAITAFVVPWTLLLIVASIPGLVEPDLSQSMWSMIWLALMGVVLGCVLGALVGAFSPSAAKPVDYETSVDFSRLMPWHWALTFALAGFGVLRLFKVRALINQFGGWAAIFSSSGGEFRNAQLNQSAAAAQTGLDSSGALIGVAGYVLFLGHASLITGAILWCSGRRYIALFPLIVSAAFAVLTLDRTSFVMSELLFAVMVVLFASRRSGPGIRTPSTGPPRQGMRTLVPTLIVVGFTAVAVFLPLQLRNVGTTNSTGWTSMFQYLLGGILGLSARDRLNSVSAPPPPDGFMSAGPAPGYGAYTFRGLFRVLHQLGFPVPVGPNAYEDYPVAVGGIRYWTNIGTSIFDFRLDFGWVGICVLFFALSFVATILQQRQQRSGGLYTVPLTAYFLVTLVWSFFGSSLLVDIKYLMVALFGCYLLSLILTIRTESPTNRDSEAPARAGPLSASHLR